MGCEQTFLYQTDADIQATKSSLQLLNDDFVILSESQVNTSLLTCYIHSAGYETTKFVSVEQIKDNTSSRR